MIQQLSLFEDEPFSLPPLESYPLLTPEEMEDAQYSFEYAYTAEQAEWVTRHGAEWMEHEARLYELDQILKKEKNPATRHDLEREFAARRQRYLQMDREFMALPTCESAESDEA